MENDLLRRVPVSVEAEQSVLGSILIKPAECFEAIAGMIGADDFYMKEHQVIFTAMQEMFLSSSKIDTVTLVNKLVESGARDESGGLQYITQIAEIVPTAANVKDYAAIVRDKALLRALIGASEEIGNMAYSEQGKAEDVVDAAEQMVFDLSKKRQTNQLRHIRDIIGTVYQDIVARSENQDVDKGVQTGFSALDRVLVKLSEGDLVIVGARPGMGKTSFCMNIATNYAKNNPKAVAVFSLEMSCEQIVSRMLSSEAMVDGHSLRSGEIKPDEWTRLADSATMLAGCNILIDDSSSSSVADMKAKLRRVKDLGLVVVDYLQLMQSTKKTDNRVQEVSDISRNLKIMAKDLKVPVICCAQLSRGNESRTDKKPMLSDLRDSGAIEQDADVVLFLYRSEYYNTAESASENGEANTAEVIVAKNRHGSVESVKMGWIGQFTKFRSLETDFGTEVPQ